MAGRVAVDDSAASPPSTPVPVVVSVACFDDEGTYLTGDDREVAGTLSADVVATGPVVRHRNTSGNIPGRSVTGGTTTYAEASGQVRLVLDGLTVDRATDHASIGTARRIDVAPRP